MLARRSRVPAARMKDLRGFAKLFSPFFSVRSKKSSLGYSRFAVIAGTKVDRRAARRHLLKRRVAGYLVRQKHKDPRDVIVAVLPPAAKLQRHEFYKELGKLLDSID